MVKHLKFNKFYLFTTAAAKR